MRFAPHRALRFVHPDLDRGLGPPGLRCSPNEPSGLETVAGAASIRQAILLLLSTRLGERVMRPGYGSELFRLAFLPNDETTAGLAIHYVRRALTLWEPRVKILKLDAARHPEQPDRLDVFLEYSVLRTGTVDRLTLPLDLQGRSQASF